MTQHSSILAKIPYREYLSELSYIFILGLFSGAVSATEVNNVSDDDWKIRSRDILVGIATTDYWTTGVRFLPRARDSSPQYPKRLWGSPSLSNRNKGPFLRDKAAEAGNWSPKFI
jgi:hypothetical protein